MGESEPMGTEREDLQAHRLEAGRRWRVAFQGERFQDIPGYFLDRISTRIRRDGSILDADLFYDIPQFTVSVSRTPLVLRTQELIGDFFPPPLDSSYDLSPWATDILDSWSAMLIALGVDVPTGHYDLNAFATLRQAYESSVYFPGRVAIDGPRFLNTLGQGAEGLVRRLGKKRVVDFAIVMCFIHERTHLLQKGEPLLCEYLLSIAWVHFIEQQGLQDLQINPDSGRWATVEKEFHVQESLILNSLGQLTGDTAKIDEVLTGAGGHPWYTHLCDVAADFDRGQYNYRSYLTHLATDLNSMSGRAAECTTCR